MSNSGENKGGAGIALAVALVAALGGVGLGWWFLTSKDVDKKILDTSIGKAVQASLVPEEERLAYVKAHVAVRDLSIDPDMKPGDGSIDPVPGLLRVHGIVANEGDRDVDSVRLVIHTQDETNDVLGSYLEDVLDGRTLKPGEQRKFKFKIPDKKGFAGRFIHQVR